MVAEFYLTLDAIKLGNLDLERSPPARRRPATASAPMTSTTSSWPAFGNGHPTASPPTMWAEVSEIRAGSSAVHVGVFPDSMAYVGGGYDVTSRRLVRTCRLHDGADRSTAGIDQTPAHRFRLRVVRIGAHDDVANLVHGVLVPNLPTFAARLRGVPDK